MLSKPLCFVLMPFGQKVDPQLGRAIDFDAVYKDIIAPAIEQAEMEPIRADEEQVGGTIHKPMFERLLLCDFAVADLTGANANVFYELGIRHAIRPRSTVLVACQGTLRPFDVAPLRTYAYAVDANGKPASAAKDAEEIGKSLRTVIEDESADSPIFQLVEEDVRKGDIEIPGIRVAHAKTDIFRKHVAEAKEAKARIDEAVRGGQQAVRALARDEAFKDLHRVDAGIVINLFLAHRAVKDFEAMVALYPNMPNYLQQVVMVREQYALALNRIHRDAEAEAVISELIEKYGGTSENLGLLGRIHKDRWSATKKTNPFLAAGHLDAALDAYLKGFEADWRDTYPGVNALTMFEMLDEPDPRREDVLPVVRYAAERAARSAGADYWAYATLLEIAVLGRKPNDARKALSTALVKAQEAFAPETTANNLGMIREKRQAAGEETGWVAMIEAELMKRAEALKQGQPTAA